MPTLAFTVQDDGYWQGWSAFTGDESAHKCIDDSTDTTHDSEVTAVTLGRLLLNPHAGRMSFPIMVMAEHIIPLSFTLTVAAIRGAASHPNLQIGFSRETLIGFHTTLFTPGAAYSTVTLDFPVNPITGVAWTADDLVGLEACVQSSFGSVGSNDISLISGTMDYSLTKHHKRVNFGAETY